MTPFSATPKTASESADVDLGAMFQPSDDESGWEDSAAKPPAVAEPDAPEAKESSPSNVELPVKWKSLFHSLGLASDETEKASPAADDFEWPRNMSLGSPTEGEYMEVMNAKFVGIYAAGLSENGTLVSPMSPTARAIIGPPIQGGKLVVEFEFRKEKDNDEVGPVRIPECPA